MTRPATDDGCVHSRSVTGADEADPVVVGHGDVADDLDAGIRGRSVNAPHLRDQVVHKTSLDADAVGVGVVESGGDEDATSGVVKRAGGKGEFDLAGKSWPPKNYRAPVEVVAGAGEVRRRQAGLARGEATAVASGPRALGMTGQTRLPGEAVEHRRVGRRGIPGDAERRRHACRRRRRDEDDQPRGRHDQDSVHPSMITPPGSIRTGTSPARCPGFRGRLT